MDDDEIIKWLSKVEKRQWSIKFAAKLLMYV